MPFSSLVYIKGTDLGQIIFFSAGTGSKYGNLNIPEWFLLYRSCILFVLYWKFIPYFLSLMAHQIRSHNGSFYITKEVNDY